MLRPCVKIQNTVCDIALVLERIIKKTTTDPQKRERPTQKEKGTQLMYTFLKKEISHTHVCLFTKRMTKYMYSFSHSLTLDHFFFFT